MVLLTIVCVLCDAATIFHGRNLDWGFNGLPNMTYTMQYMSGGNVVYYTTSFVGA